jgi:hypothetical protein
MTTRYDLCTGRKDQNGKTHWTKVGVMFPSREGDGFSIKLEAYPLPNDKGEVWVSAFVPKERDESGIREQTIARSPQAPARGRAPIADDVPFAPEWR